MSTEEKNTDETSRTIAASNGKNNWESRGNESLSTKEGKVLREQNSLMVKILSVFAIVAGILLIVLSQTGPESWGQFARDLFLAIGLAIAPSGLIGLITDYLIFGRTMETLVDEVKQFGTENNKLSEQVKALQVSTEFLKQSSELGLEMIYPDRGSALKFFANLMRKQAKSESKEQSGRLIIVGSSIKGLREAIRNLEDIITEASKNPYCDFRILLTHPQYCRYRENQEERPPGAIEEEIYATMLLLEDNWFKSDDENKSSTPMESRMESDGGKNNKEINKSIAHNVKLYKGTPTCFMIIAGDHMLINPYPYEKEAFKSFCLLVRELNKTQDSEEVPKSIYQQFYSNHFKTPWQRNALPYYHFFLEGPIPLENEEDRKKYRYGDIFVIQDSSKFDLIIVLSGNNNQGVRGVPPSIPVERGDNEFTRRIILGDEFIVKLLPVTETPDCAENCWTEPSIDKDIQESGSSIIKLDKDSHKSDKGVLKLDKDRRSGKFRGIYNGNFFNDYQMIGLFSKDEKLVNPFKHLPVAKRADLHNQHLPMFWYWITNKPNIPEHPPIESET